MEKPSPLNEDTIKSMKSNKRRDTRVELKLRRMLREAGYPGYRLQWKVPGRPDIAYPGKRIAIMVNGCFWHRCPMCDLPLPVHNAEFWKSKFDANVERDCRNRSELESMGWTGITVWECEMKKKPQEIMDEILMALNKSRRG